MLSTMNKLTDGAAVLVLYNKEGKVYWEHRGENRKRNKGLWGFFGGGIEEGETPESAVTREAKEELQYTLNDPKIHYVHKMDGWDMYVFIESYDESQPIVLDPNESVGAEWLTLEKIQKLSNIPQDADALAVVWPDIQERVSISSR